MKVIAIMIVLALLVAPSMALAEKMEDPVTGAVKTVGKAAKGTVDTAVSPVQALGRGEPGHMVTDPVETGAKTVGEAAVDTGKTATLQEVEMQD